MTIWRKIALAAILAVACGCEKEPVAPKQEASAPVPRMQDPAYTNALNNVQKKRRAIASRRRELVEQMEALVARARKALPADATEEQIRNELLNNPRKYPGWREFSRALREMNVRAEKELEEARRLVAARIMKEQEGLSKRGGAK